MVTPTGPKWLLLFNCQALGLANCIGMVNPEIALEYCDFPRFRKTADQYLDKLDSYDLVVTAPQFLYTDVADLSKLANLAVLPTVYFDGYHPDLCHVHSGTALVKGPLGDYHSALAFAAYKSGLDTGATRKLFNAKMYERLGFFGRWEEAKQQLLAGFSSHGLELSAAFTGWSRSPTAFMHSVNHPDREAEAIYIAQSTHVAATCRGEQPLVVWDVGLGAAHNAMALVRALVRSRGLQDRAIHLLPHDNLLNGPVFPVYEEIAERYSIHGSYQFKLAGQYRHVDLDQFIRGSFDVYDQHDRASLTVHAMHRALHENIVDRIQEQR